MGKTRKKNPNGTGLNYARYRAIEFLKKRVQGEVQ